ATPGNVRFPTPYERRPRNDSRYRPQEDKLILSLRSFSRPGASLHPVVNVPAEVARKLLEGWRGPDRKTMARFRGPIISRRFRGRWRRGVDAWGGAAALRAGPGRFSVRGHTDTSPLPPVVHDADAVTRSGGVEATRAEVAGSSGGHFAEDGPGYRAGRGGPNLPAMFGDGVVFQISIAADCSWNRGTFRATGSGVRSSDHDGMTARFRRGC